MATKLKFILLLAVIGLISGAFWVISGSVQAQPVEFQAAKVFTLENPDGTLSDLADVPGGANLTRRENSISYGFYTTQLNPGSAYILWVVIFNRPENCVDGCNAEDLGIPAVRASIVYGGSSYIAGPDGTGNFQGSLEKGYPPNGTSVDIPAGTANGLMSPLTAEIHLGLHDHGPIAAGMVGADQVSTFGGGCNNEAYLDEWGRAGDFFCATTQAAVFLSPGAGNQ